MSNITTPPQAKKSLVDRSIVQILPHPTTTTTPSTTSPSTITPDQELTHRIHGISLLTSAAILLRQSHSTRCTSCTLFHRFFHRRSLEEYDVWSVAMACTLLGGKVEEEARKARSVVLVYAHLYRRRRLRVDDPTCPLITSNDKPTDDENDLKDIHSAKCPQEVVESPLARLVSNDEKRNVLRHVPVLSPLGQAYGEWYDALTDMEHVILKELGFTLYWIPDSHPHRYLTYMAEILELDAQVLQTAWNYCNDSYFFDFCVRFQPELVACASILMAANHHTVTLPLHPRPWWEVFVGPEQQQQQDHLMTICNAILALQSYKPAAAAMYDHKDQVKDKNKDQDASMERVEEEDNAEDDVNLMMGRAFFTYMVSFVQPEGCFLDPGSFLWTLADLKEEPPKNKKDGDEDEKDDDKDGKDGVVDHEGD